MASVIEKTIRKAVAPAIMGVANHNRRKLDDAEHRPVVEAAAGDDSPAVRAGAALTLGRYGDEAAAARLGELMAGDPEAKVRLAAAAGLGRIRSHNSVGLLVLAVENNEVPAVRLRALRALSKLYGFELSGLPAPTDAGAWRKVVEMAYGLPGAKKAVEALRPTKQE